MSEPMIREAAFELVKALQARHYGRMPDEVQVAFDRLLAAIAAPPARSERAQRHTGALIEAGSYEGITVRPSEVAEWVRAEDFDMPALNHQSQTQYCLNHHAPKPDPESVLLSVPRNEVEAVAAFLTQRAAGGAEGQQGRQNLVERIAQIQAHRACHSAEHDPLHGMIHGYCVVCGVPFPCAYVGRPVPQGERAPEREKEK